MRNYEVLVWYDPETNQREIRCRSDITKHYQFKRLGNNLVSYKSKRTNKERVFMIQFSGSKKDALRFAGTLDLGYTGLGAEHHSINVR